MSFCFAWEKRKKSKVVSAQTKYHHSFYSSSSSYFFFSSLKVVVLGSLQKALFHASWFDTSKSILQEKKNRDFFHPKDSFVREKRGIFDFSLSFLRETTTSLLALSLSLSLRHRACGELHPHRSKSIQIDPNRKDESRIATTSMIARFCHRAENEGGREGEKKE